MFNQVGKVKEINGSILTPQNAGLRFVVNFANMAGTYEGEVADLFVKKWPKVKSDVRMWYANKTGEYKPGAIYTTAVQSDTWVMSLLVLSENGKVDAEGLETAVKKLGEAALYEKASVHFPQALALKAKKLKSLADKYLVQKGVSVSYYTE